MLAGLHGDEGGTHGDFGFAETDVTADDAIHRLLGTKISHHLADGIGLIGGFFEGKGVGKGLVFQIARGEAQSASSFAPRIEIEQFGGDVAHLLGRTLAGATPLIGAELVQRGGFGGCTGVATDEMQRMHGYVQPITALIFEHQEFAALAADLHHLQSDVASDAVFLVDHGGARGERLQIAQDGVRVGSNFASATLLTSARAEELRFGEYDERRFVEREPGEFRRYRERERSVTRDELSPALAGSGLEVCAAQQFAEHFAPSG